MNRDLTAVGQVWEDRKGRRRTVVGMINSNDQPVQSWAEIPQRDPHTGKTYNVIWQRDPTSKPRMAWCSTWESWVQHATLVQEDS